MNRFITLSMLIAAAALAGDVRWKNGNTTDLGLVNQVNCVRDGGLLCTRDAGSIGDVRCMAGSATETGCVTPGAQTFAGDKTFSGNPRIVGAAHGSLPACSAGAKGTWSTCTTHNAPVFCNGTTNIELAGATSLTTLATLQVNRLVHGLNGYLGAFTLPYDFTVTTISGIILSGAGTTMNLRVTDGAGTNCDCSVDCTTGTVSACTGNCTFTANTQVLATPNSDGCTTPITVFGALTVTGYKL